MEPTCYYLKILILGVGLLTHSPTNNLGMEDLHHLGYNYNCFYRVTIMFKAKHAKEGSVR
jgi:hypothetical protein